MCPATPTLPTYSSEGTSGTLCKSPCGVDFVRKLIFVYKTKSGLLGDLKGAVQKAVSGASECSLCTITYGVTSEKPDWKTFRQTLSVPTEFYHRDNVPSRIRDFLATTSAGLPVILAEEDDGLHPAVTAQQLHDCRRDEKCLIGLLQSYASSSPVSHPAE